MMDIQKRPASPTKTSGLPVPKSSRLPTPQTIRTSILPLQNISGSNDDATRPISTINSFKRPSSPTKTVSALTVPSRRVSGISLPPTTSSKLISDRTSSSASPTKLLPSPIKERVSNSRAPLSPTKSTTLNRNNDTSRIRPASTQRISTNTTKSIPRLTSSANGNYDSRIYSPRSPESSGIISALLSPRIGSETPTYERANRRSLSERTVETLSKIPGTPSSVTSKRQSTGQSPQSPINPSLTKSQIQNRTSMINSVTVAKRSAPGRTSVIGSGLRPPSPVKRSIQPLSAIRRASAESPAKSMSNRRTVSATISTSSIIGASDRNRDAMPMSRVQPRSSNSTMSIKTVRYPNRSDAVNRSFSANHSITSDQDSQHSNSPMDYNSVDDFQSVAASVNAFKQALQKAAEQKRVSSVPETSYSVDSFDLFPDNVARQQQEVAKKNQMLLEEKLTQCRVSGILNISGLELRNMTSIIEQMRSSQNARKGQAETLSPVDLTIVKASNNSLVELDDALLPDVAASEAYNDDSIKASFMIGISELDVSRNQLTSLAIGMQHMQRLTILDLSHNELGNTSFEVILKVKSLKQLLLSNNNFSGFLPQSICGLDQLEVLDISNNRIHSLPDSLRNLTKLQVLDLSGNQLTGVPTEALEVLPLTKLDLSSNALLGALFSFNVTGLGMIEELNVSNNSLASLAFSETLSFPKIQILKLSNNRMISLPDISGWTELVTLTVSDNQLQSLPQGFVSLRKVRHADFTNNSITRLESRVAQMDSLESLLISGNPFTEQKHLTMSVEAIKRELLLRTAPTPQKSRISLGLRRSLASPLKSIDDDETMLFQADEQGRLDLHDQGLVDEDADGFRELFSMNDVRDLNIASNQLTILPFELCLAQQLRVLDVSVCNLAEDYLKDRISLPSLEDLSLSGNRICSLQPLLEFLAAPKLQRLDMSNNLLRTSLPNLHVTFPNLMDLNVTFNRIPSVNADSIRGLQTVDLANNNITALDPEIGLLWFEGLRLFCVTNNDIQGLDPSIIDQGTETLLCHLRKSIPGYIGDDETF